MSKKPINVTRETATHRIGIQRYEELLAPGGKTYLAVSLTEQELRQVYDALASSTQPSYPITANLLRTIAEYLHHAKG